MSYLKPVIGVAIALTLAGCVAGQSTQHASAAAGHSAAASGESAAAVATGAAAVVAVPLVSVGSAMAVSGAGLADAGNRAVTDGTAILAGDVAAPTTTVQPMGPPTLN